MSNTRCTINGGCGSSDAMAEYEDHFHCYSCKHTRYKTYAETKNVSNFNKNSHKILHENITELSKDLIDVPINCQYYQWLRKYWPQSNFPSAIRYSPEDDKLIVVLGLGEFFVRGNNPKYTQLVSTSKWTTSVPPNAIIKQLVVIVEDIFSAIKVSENGYLTICIYGSSCSNALLSDILQYAKHNMIIIWLDKDKAGITASNKIARFLNNYIDLNVKQIFTDKDPKECTEEEINEALR